jgi:RHS repeat-associated protein
MIWIRSRQATTNHPQLVITPNEAPTVSLTSPANDATFTAPATITLTASAADPDGTIQKVEFFHGGTNLIATVTAAPYTFNWTNVGAGAYTLTAKATDNLGGETTSAPVNVTVNTGVAQLFFIHSDHLNTPRVITNGAGQAVWRWDQADPFGGNAPNENPSGLGAFTCNLRLPGQYFDKETNLHYNYFRDYDPAIGRYVQSDPIGLRGGNNTYAYSFVNPLIYTDPDGQFVQFLGAFWGPIVQALTWASTAVGLTSGAVATTEALQQRQANEVLGNLVQNQWNYCSKVNFSDPACGTLNQNRTRWLQCTGQTTAAGAQIPGTFPSQISPTWPLKKLDELQ